jgi:hypothetical protein
MGVPTGDRRGQGIDAVSAAVAEELRLTVDELRVLSLRVGADDLPAVLDMQSRHATIDGREAAFDQAARELLSRNLFVGDVVHPDLVPVLQALARPDREVAMRLVTPQGTARIIVARRDTLCVSARRVGEDISLRILGHCNELSDVIAALSRELPSATPADVDPVTAPLLEMTACLSGTHDAMELADRIRTLGAEPRTAMRLGVALGSRQAFAEIVYRALAKDEGRIRRGPAAVGVLYTKRGRIIGAPSASPTGQLWTTLKAGTERALGQAITQLVELADERWGDR